MGTVLKARLRGARAKASVSARRPLPSRFRGFGGVDACARCNGYSGPDNGRPCMFQEIASRNHRMVLPIVCCRGQNGESSEPAAMPQAH